MMFVPLRHTAVVMVVLLWSGCSAHPRFCEEAMFLAIDKHKALHSSGNTGISVLISWWSPPTPPYQRNAAFQDMKTGIIQTR